MDDLVIYVYVVNSQMKSNRIARIVAIGGLQRERGGNGSVHNWCEDSRVVLIH